MDLEIYDTTLRDGSQQEGISLTVNDKLRVARLLDELETVLGLQSSPVIWPLGNGPSFRGVRLELSVSGRKAASFPRKREFRVPEQPGFPRSRK